MNRLREYIENKELEANLIFCFPPLLPESYRDQRAELSPASRRAVFYSETPEVGNILQLSFNVTFRMKQKLLT